MTRRHVLTLTLAIIILTAAACSSPDGDRSTSPADEQHGDKSPTHEANTTAIEGDLEKQIDKKLSGPPWNKPVAGTRVTCPTDVEWQVGDSFQCDVDAPGFPRGFAEVTLEDNDGQYRWYLNNQ